MKMSKEIISLKNPDQCSATILPYDPEEYPRETARHYISASESDIEQMLASIGLERVEDLFAHLRKEVRFSEDPVLPEELSYDNAVRQLRQIAASTNLRHSFIGDLLPAWKTHPIVEEVSRLRPLSTSYTPYQPERSQGTLVTHWIYQCVLSALTGFEAVNTSLYDRSAAIFEAVCCARRSRRKSGKVLLARSLFPEDVEFKSERARSKIGRAHV